MCFFPDAFKVDISLKNIKGKALSFPLPHSLVSHQRSLLLSFPVLSILKYLSSNVYCLSAFLPRIPLLCTLPAAAWHEKPAQDGGNILANFALRVVSLSVRHSPLLRSSFLPPHDLDTSAMWFSLILTENSFVFSAESLIVSHSEGLGSTSTALNTILCFLSRSLFFPDFSFF